MDRAPGVAPVPARLRLPVAGRPGGLGHGGLPAELPVAVRAPRGQVVNHLDEVTGRCGASPPAASCPADLTWLVCSEGAGHADGKPAERHRAAGYWWSERQQAPVRDGHVHSTGYFCSPACPGYEDGLR
jgi:hypothetical protein